MNRFIQVGDSIINSELIGYVAIYENSKIAMYGANVGNYTVRFVVACGNNNESYINMTGFQTKESAMVYLTRIYNYLNSENK